MVPKCNHMYPYKRGRRRNSDTNAQRMWRQNKERWGHKMRLTATRIWKRQRRDSPLGPPEGAEHLNYRLLASRIVRESIPVVWSHQVCGNLLQQWQETNTWGDKNQKPKQTHRGNKNFLIINWTYIKLLIQKGSVLQVTQRLPKTSNPSFQRVNWGNHRMQFSQNISKSERTNSERFTIYIAAKKNSVGFPQTC